jgi:hypothetical protein
MKGIYNDYQNYDTDIVGIIIHTPKVGIHSTFAKNAFDPFLTVQGLNISISYPGEYTIVLSDIRGRKIDSFSGKGPYTWSMSEKAMNDRLYILTINTAENRYTRKVVFK